ncbi:uncharacterized protein A4U43_C04F13670 [Asparagus officinalis]|uniref:Uncharacterized protein n=1 Tax=Asparagus officinalis TaxID=4686 RepID=A0A5P1F5Z7_ASPOF|nr:uncharacterized protein A4U43_C04F13670 [Asparagus officinalis]
MGCDTRGEGGLGHEVRGETMTGWRCQRRMTTKCRGGQRDGEELKGLGGGDDGTTMSEEDVEELRGRRRRNVEEDDGTKMSRRTTGGRGIEGDDGTAVYESL